MFDRVGAALEERVNDGPEADQSQNPEWQKPKLGILGLFGYEAIMTQAACDVSRRKFLVRGETSDLIGFFADHLLDRSVGRTVIYSSIDSIVSPRRGSVMDGVPACAVLGIPTARAGRAF